MDKKAQDAAQLTALNDPQSIAAVWPRYVAIGLSLYVFLGGFISFLGYPLNIPALTDWNHEGISIQANTTIAVMATGLTLLLLSFGYRKLSVVLSALVGLIGATSIFQMATQIDLGFNTFLMFGREWGRFGVLIPGLMGTPGATSWTLLGTALLLLSLFSQGHYQHDQIKARNSSVLLALLSMGISSLSLIGYLYGAAVLYTLPRFTVIAIQTATFIFAASLSVILLIRETGPMRLFADRGPAGILTRRIVPTIVLLPILVGALRLAGENAGLYDTAFGSASRTLVEIVFLLCILWWTGTALEGYARRASQNERELQQLADAMPQVVWIANEEGKTGYYNRRVENFGGIKQVDGELYDWQAGIHPEDLESTIKLWNAAVRDTKVYEQEHRMLMADGSYRWHLSRAVPFVEEDGGARRWYGTATDIHDQKSAEVTLRESEQRFSRFMQHLPGLSWIKDAYGKYVYANEAAQKAFSTPMPELFGKSDDDIFPPEVAATFTENDRKALESPLGIQTVEELKDETGKLRYSIVSKFPIPSANGSKPMVGGMAIDITEQRNAEINKEFLLKISEMVRIGRNAEDLLADISVVLGRHLEVHRCLFNEIDLENDTETVHRDYARDGESVAGRHSLSEYSSIASDAMRAGLTIVNQNSETDPRTADYFEKTYGPNREIAYITVPMLRGGKWVASLWCSDDKPRVWTDVEVALVENIAERTWASVERLRTEITASRLAAIVSSSDDAIISKDLNGIITSWNHGAESVFGYTPAEVIGRSITILIPPDRLDEEPAILSRIRKGESIDHYETVRRRKDGALLDISLTVSPIHDAQGEIIGASKVARDITEQKRAEEQIKMISRVPEENPNPVMRVTPAGEILYSNPAAKPVLQSWRRSYGEKLPVDFHTCVSRVFDRNTRETLEIAFDDRFLSCNFAPVAELGYVNVYADDVTERKNAEEALRISEERYRTLFDSMDEGYCIIEVIFDENEKPVDYLFVEINPAFESQSGMHDVVGRRMLEFVSVIEEHWLNNYGNVAITGEPVRFTGEYKGLHRFFEVYAFRIGDSFSRRIAVLFTDVTSRTQAADALRLSEERYRVLTELSPQFVFMSTPDGSMTYVNQFGQDFLGKTLEELKGDGWARALHPDHREAELEKWRLATATGTDYESDLCLLYKDGTYRTVYARAQPMIAEDGRFLYWIGTALDVEDRKQTEEKLRASETQLRLVTDAIPALVSYIDDKENYRFVNRQYSDWFTKSPKELIGRKMRDVVGARAYAVIRPYLAEALSGTEVSFDSWINYKSAGQRYVHISYVPDKLADGRVVGLFGLVSDLSDLKRSEDLLRASQERMRLLTESFTDYAIFSTDVEGLIESWNPGAQTIFGYDEQEIIGKSSEILFIPEDVAKNAPIKERRNARDNSRSSDERWHVRKDGTRFFASGVMVPLYVAGILRGYAKIASDLTERKRNAEALQRAHDEMEFRVLERTRELAEANAALVAEINERKAAEEQKIDLLKRLVTTQEDERRRIARDIHDQLGQRLTALRLKIASLRELVGKDKELEARTTRLQEIAELLDSEVSFLAWELRPAAIEEFGLVDAIGAFVHEWSRHYGIDAEFQSAGMAKFHLDQDADTHLYRIAQEALNNIVKHANASKVNVIVERTGNDVILIVEDNGVGFDRSALKPRRKSGNGLGLTGMSERASLINGDTEIESTPGRGTTIFVRVPISKADRNGKL